MSGASAHHSYLLTVQQLRAGLTKASSIPQKGFIFIDVRSTEEHATGFIPETDLNIEFRDIQVRHRDIGARLDDPLVVYCQSGYRSNISLVHCLDTRFSPAWADPDHGWKSDVGCDAVFQQRYPGM
jgi:hypothetical protein